MSKFTKFTNKARDFFHLSDGWCTRQVQRPNGELVWRIFYGVLRPGAPFPNYVSVYKEGGETVDLEDFLDAVQWVENRRGP